MPACAVFATVDQQMVSRWKYRRKARLAQGAVPELFPSGDFRNFTAYARHVGKQMVTATPMALSRWKYRRKARLAQGAVTELFPTRDLRNFTAYARHVGKQMVTATPMALFLTDALMMDAKAF